jgi:CopG family nickel-responsive transcriptional regulator
VVSTVKPSFKGVTRFSVSLPPSLVRDFDEAWKGLGYDNRSKAAHDAFRSFISEFKWSHEEKEEIAGAIVLLYYVDKPGLLNEIVLLQHKFEKVVSSSMHIHLTKDKCLEIIAVRGKADTIRNLSQELMTKKGVKQLKFTTIEL